MRFYSTIKSTSVSLTQNVQSKGFFVCRIECDSLNLPWIPCWMNRNTIQNPIEIHCVWNLVVEWHGLMYLFGCTVIRHTKYPNTLCGNNNMDNRITDRHTLMFLSIGFGGMQKCNGLANKSFELTQTLHTVQVVSNTSGSPLKIA